MTNHPLNLLSERYAQLLLPVKPGMKDTEQYKDAVLRGKKAEGNLEFVLDERDTLTSFETPAGTAEILVLNNRNDFEHAIHALAYRCEPIPIPPSMGASTISGIINWKKIHDHMNSYEADGGTDSDEEFSRFTSEKSNYLDTLILLSTGEYSAVSAAEMGLEKEDWLNKSLIIRKFHELSHFCSRRLFPENKEEIRDEIVADMIGIISAFGYYDCAAARRFLGIEGTVYREGGRLQNYVGNNDGASVMERALNIITVLSESVSEMVSENVFDLLNFVEKNKIGTL